MTDDFDAKKYFEEVNREHAIRAHERSYEVQLEFQKAAIEYSIVVVRSLILINGAAVIALLAFLGAIEASDGASQFSSTRLVSPILWFALGVGFASAAGAIGYLVVLMDHGISMDVRHHWEHPYVTELDTTTANRSWRSVLHYAAIAAAGFALVAFFGGTISVVRAVTDAGI